PASAQTLTNVNHVLNRADIQLNDVQSNAGEQRLAETLNEKLEKQGLEKIKPEDLATLAKAKPEEVHETVEPDNRPLVQALAAEARTKEVSVSTQPMNAAEAGIVKLIQGTRQ